MYATHVYFEDGTPGYRVVGVVWVLLCASAAEALWLASPPYHSHLCKVQRTAIGLMLSNKQ